jgi:hypothetical protein
MDLSMRLVAILNLWGIAEDWCNFVERSIRNCVLGAGRGLLGTGFAEVLVEGEAEEDEGGAEEGVAEVGEVGVEEQGGGGEDEEGWDYWVAGDLVGLAVVGDEGGCCLRGGSLAVAEDEDGGGGDAVEEPLGEDGELEELLEAADGEEQEGG